MPASKVYKKGDADISFNMTPMIDCTFQLILFFMLTTQIASADFVALNAPKPDTSQASEQKSQPESVYVRVTVAPFSKSEIAEKSGRRGQVKFYVVRGVKYKHGKIDEVVTALEQIKYSEARDKKLIVEIRADRAIHYTYVEDALGAIKQAQVATMWLTARPEPRGGG